jgi:hypothetical protein
VRALLALMMVFGCVGSAAAQDTSAAPPAAPPSDVTVEAVLARNVVDRAPQDSGSTFPADVGTVVLWMRATGAEGHTLTHVWFHGETEVGNVPLVIGGSPWRTWSRKTIPAEATGAWHVEVRDAAGNTLKRIDFTVGQ